MKFRPSHPHVKKKNCKAWLASDNTSQIAQIVAHIQDLSVIFFFLKSGYKHWREIEWARRWKYAGKESDSRFRILQTEVGEHFYVIFSVSNADVWTKVKCRYSDYTFGRALNGCWCDFFPECLIIFRN